MAAHLVALTVDNLAFHWDTQMAVLKVLQTE
jgi:hypothetical protein